MDKKAMPSNLPCKINCDETNANTAKANKHGAYSVGERKFDFMSFVCKSKTSLLWFISGQAWLSEGREGDLLGVTSTGEPEYPTSAVGSGTSEYKQLDTGQPSKIPPLPPNK